MEQQTKKNQVVKNEYDATTAEKLIREIPKALLNWYDFRPDSRILYIGEEDSYAEVLKEYADQMIYVNCDKLKEGVWQEEHEGYFDYAVCVEKLELDKSPLKVLRILFGVLKPGGTMLLGMNNRLGVRYFCGDRDPYTNRNFDGVENYRRAYVKEEDAFQGRMYAREELEQMLMEAGWECGQFQFFTVLSDLHNPSFLYAEDYLPNEDLANRLFPTYNYPDTVFIDEEPLYQSFIKNGMFHKMANAYLIECSKSGDLSDVRHVTGSLERGREDALLTIIHRAGIVEKRAVYPEGKERLKQIDANAKDLKAHGLKVVDVNLVQGVCQMPYVEAEVGHLYLKKLLQTDKEVFLEKMDHFKDLIMQSSEIVKPDQGDGLGAILHKGYLDLVPLNSFYLNNEFIFFDQEFCEENYPANVLIQRMISTLYAGNYELEKILPSEELYKRYGIAEYRRKLQEIEWAFLRKLLKQKELRIYHEKCRRNAGIVNANRQRMNYSEMDHQRIFLDVFKGLTGRKVILFGSGLFAKRFIGMYGKDYPISFIVDNSESKWGSELEGIKILPPDTLRELKGDEYKVVICIKNFLSVLKQLRDMDIKNYSIFDPDKSYPRRQSVIVQTDAGKAIPKKYRIGYVAGVFDMFHVGHVNLLRRAKEQCEYLIVGLVSDEGVYRQKKKNPIIPCEDRMEVLRSCRYVDQVEVLPADYATIQDAYKMFQFDCMFSGDDHGDDIGWLADKQFLEKSGVDIVFFNYTEKVSSTRLREKLGGLP